VFVAAEEMINLHHGQGFDIFWRDHQICPTEEEYKKMVLDSTRTLLLSLLTQSLTAYLWAETGGLFRLAVKLIQAFSKDER
jgi:geranylgeranyl diphosphate synthase type 3